MMVKVIKEFCGVLDGTAYPRIIKVGEIIHGDLGALAFKEKWATDSFDEPLPPAPDEAKAPAASEAGAAPDASAQTGATIPTDWKTLKWFALRKLAETIKGSEVANSDEAKVVIETEIANRAAAAK